MIKLIDFGLSQLNQTLSTKMSEQVGTPYYVAPEVIKGKYVSKCDMWSFGVLLYIMLSGYLPFTGDDAEEVYKKVQSAKFTMEQKEWKKVSEEAKDLVSKLLVVDYKKRLSAKDAMEHEWFKR